MLPHHFCSFLCTHPLRLRAGSPLCFWPGNLLRWCQSGAGTSATNIQLEANMTNSAAYIYIYIYIINYRLICTCIILYNVYVVYMHIMYYTLYIYINMSLMDGCLQRSNKPDPCHYCLSSAISLRHSASETELMTAPRWTKRNLKSLESKRHLIPWSLVDPGMLFCPSIQFGLSTWYQSSRLVEHKESWKMMKIPTRRSTVDGVSYKGLSWCLSTLVYSTTFSIIL